MTKASTKRAINIKSTLAVAGVLSAGICVPTNFGFAAPKSSKVPKQKIPASILIENKRQSELTNFSVYESGMEDTALSSLSAPLTAGKKVNLSLKGLKSCAVTLFGTFADGSDAGGEVDVCVEKQIRLLD